MRILLPRITLLAFALFATHLGAIASDSFEKNEAKKKAQHVWSEVTKNAYGSSLPEMEAPSAWEMTDLMSADYDAIAFTHDGDFMPSGRKKLIHGFGTNVRIAFVPEQNSPYTGIFSTGAQEGIARISLAVVPPQKRGGKLVPGIALKWFVNNKPSLNVMAMPSLDGQCEENIFEHIYTTNVGKPEWSFKTWLLEKRFTSALEIAGQPDGNPRSFSLNHFASTTPMGEIVSFPVAPFELLLVPTQAIRTLYAKRTNDDFRARLEGVGEGVELFQVFARPNLQSQPELIGHVVAKSNFVASSFSDYAMFFKHPPMHNWSEFADDDNPEL